ncbi:hypothetical protein [Neorhizobium tomejilense]|uniref:hypothetical protein n=1 Tax=Neorhizobium tomejilense TaxID=2093828 RepID=UPI003ED0AA9A
MDDETDDFWVLLAHHAEVIAKLDNLQAKSYPTIKDKREIKIRALEEQSLRERLLDFKPSSNAGGQTKLLYFTLLLAKTETSLDDQAIARLLRSLDHIL